jgi:hypothetical protein
MSGVSNISSAARAFSLLPHLLQRNLNGVISLRFPSGLPSRNVNGWMNWRTISHWARKYVIAFLARKYHDITTGINSIHHADVRRYRLLNQLRKF